MFLCSFCQIWVSNNDDDDDSDDEPMMLWTVWSFDVAPRSHDIMVTAMEVFATRWNKNPSKPKS